jgi:hypothetical protein
MSRQYRTRHPRGNNGNTQHTANQQTNSTHYYSLNSSDLNKFLMRLTLLVEPYFFSTIPALVALMLPSTVVAITFTEYVPGLNLVIVYANPDAANGVVHLPPTSQDTLYVALGAPLSAAAVHVTAICPATFVALPATEPGTPGALAANAAADTTDAALVPPAETAETRNV